MSKKAKHKRVKDKLAKKRGAKKTKKKTPPPQTKKTLSPEVINNLLMSTLPLANLKHLVNINFDQEKLTKYLQTAIDSPDQKPIDFIRGGIKIILTRQIFDTINNILAAIAQKKDEKQEVLVAIDAYFKLLYIRISPEFIPVFVFLFAKQVKLHPLSDDPKIWKYIMNFLPKKVVAPEQKETIIVPGKQKQQHEEKQIEKRDERYPHIILPK